MLNTPMNNQPTNATKYVPRTKPLSTLTQNQVTLVTLIKSLSPVVDFNILQLDEDHGVEFLDTVGYPVLVSYLILSFGRAIVQKMIDVENNEGFYLAFTKYAESFKPQQPNKADAINKAACDFMQQLKNLNLENNDFDFLNRAVRSAVTPVMMKLQQPQSYHIGQSPRVFSGAPVNEFNLGQEIAGVFGGMPMQMQAIAPMSDVIQLQSPQFIPNMYNTSIHKTGAFHCFGDFYKMADSTLNGIIPTNLIRSTTRHMGHLQQLIDIKPDVSLNMCFQNLVKLMEHPFEGNPQFLVTPKNIVIC